MQECEGYGHIQTKCANTRKKKKSYTATWSDEEFEEREEHFNEVMVLVNLATVEDSPAYLIHHRLRQMLKLKLKTVIIKKFR